MDVLILLPEGLQVLVTHDLLQENLKFSLDFLELLGLHTHGLDFFLEFDLVLDGIVINVTILTLATIA
jgi:hypothetical protein